MKELIVDYLPFVFTKQSLSESVEGVKLRVRGILQRAEQKNQNGRIYPFDVLQREAKKYEENFVNQKRAMGELDHPDSGVVNLKNVSHNVLKMWWEGKDLMGEVEILTTPSGNILQELLRCGITLGISSRGMGTVKQIGENTVEVKDDFELIAFDFVSNPSTVGAFMHTAGNINESVKSDGVVTLAVRKWDNVETIIRDILSEVK